MEIRLAHGRTDPAEELDEWGDQGPTLRHVDSVQLMYRDTYTVKFLTNDATAEAQRLTGWTMWDIQTLEMCRHGDLIEAHGPNQAPIYYADFLILSRSSLTEVTQAAADVQRAGRALAEALCSMQKEHR